MIVIIDYGVGNPGSIENMLRKIGTQVKVSSNAADINAADKLILPGVGAFDYGMTKLHELGIEDILQKRVIGAGVPVLGICLGMQLFTRGSEEGSLPGLGWIDAETVRFCFERETSELRIPHMGWNTVEVTQGGSILDSLYEDPRFYFVHSYHVRCADPANVLSTTRYGIKFHSAVVKGNIVGTQFHPEKSHKYGLKVLRNFAEMSPSS
jgi:glutamine amidotransferase